MNPPAQATKGIKRREIVNWSIGSIVLVAVALMAYRFFFVKSGQPLTIEVVPVIDDSYDQPALSQITNADTAINFNVPIDFSSELGNSKPFGN